MRAHAGAQKLGFKSYPALAGGGFERRLEYTVPVKRNRLGPSEARCEEVQHCRRRGADGFWVSVVARTPEVPAARRACRGAEPHPRMTLSSKRCQKTRVRARGPAVDAHLCSSTIAMCRP